MNTQITTADKNAETSAEILVVKNSNNVGVKLEYVPPGAPPRFRIDGKKRERVVKFEPPPAQFFK